jgi:hypothetical protein
MDFRCDSFVSLCLRGKMIVMPQRREDTKGHKATLRLNHWEFFATFHNSTAMLFVFNVL